MRERSRKPSSHRDRVTRVPGGGPAAAHFDPLMGQRPGDSDPACLRHRPAAARAVRQQHHRAHAPPRAPAVAVAAHDRHRRPRVIRARKRRRKDRAFPSKSERGARTHRSRRSRRGRAQARSATTPIGEADHFDIDARPQRERGGFHGVGGDTCAMSSTIAL